MFGLDTCLSQAVHEDDGEQASAETGVEPDDGGPNKTDRELRKIVKLQIVLLIENPPDPPPLNPDKNQPNKTIAAPLPKIEKLTSTKIPITQTKTCLIIQQNNTIS